MEVKCVRDGGRHVWGSKVMTRKDALEGRDGKETL